jgi:hypothetical protein
MSFFARFVNRRSFRFFYSYNPTSGVTPPSPVEKAESALGDALDALEKAAHSARFGVSLKELSKFEREAIALHMESVARDVEQIQRGLGDAILAAEEQSEKYWTEK